MVKVLLRSGKEIDQIQIFLSDGVQNLYSPRFGGGGGGDRTWEVPKGEYVTQVEYRSGDRLDALTFITNKGTKSPTFGGGGGGYHLMTIPTGYRIVGIFGRCGARVDRLGFNLARTIYHDNGQEEIITE